MFHKAIEQVFERAELAKQNSDFDYFFALLLVGETVLKTTTLGVVATLDDDKDRNRYRLEYALARADGLGEWGRVLEDALTGPASQYLPVEAYAVQKEIAWSVGAAAWQHQSTTLLKSALEKLGLDGEDVPAKTDLKDGLDCLPL